MRTKTEHYPCGQSIPEHPCRKAPRHIHRPTPTGFDAATDQTIAACGGDARDAVKALIVANEFLEAEIVELQAAVSSGYARGKFEVAGPTHGASTRIQKSGLPTVRQVPSMIDVIVKLGEPLIDSPS